MMSSVERDDRFLLGARARLVDDSQEVAWAERHVRHDPDIKWILGNFVEAERANENGHIFPLDDLKVAQESIATKPLNMLHHGRYIVGAFAAAELIWPDGVDADAISALGAQQVAIAAGKYPYIEALSAFWRHEFPEEFEVVEKAHADGSLFYSMEAIPETLNCTVDGCRFTEKAVAYAGRTSDTYCDHMNAPLGQKVLNKPHFGAGALIFPPAKPGWKRAGINELATLLERKASEAEAIYAQMQGEFPHLGPKEWESLMHALVLQASE